MSGGQRIGDGRSRGAFIGPSRRKVLREHRCCGNIGRRGVEGCGIREDAKGDFFLEDARWSCDEPHDPCLDGVPDRPFHHFPRRPWDRKDFFSVVLVLLVRDGVADAPASGQYRAACLAPPPGGGPWSSTPPRLRPSACSWAPLSAGCMLVGADRAAVNKLHVPVQPPAPQAARQRGPGAIPLRCVPPGRPVRTFHKMPLIIRRWASAGRPTAGFCGGSNGASCAQCSLVKSP